MLVKQCPLAGDDRLCTVCWLHQTCGSSGFANRGFRFAIIQVGLVSADLLPNMPVPLRNSQTRAVHVKPGQALQPGHFDQLLVCLVH
ncbi:unnamed protein product [Protopolystoma xenopodis]|uniref:Uncharacterized protein n=1 Tax=Protopolystoma xenopodis TaxID=117903 RepID=A0A448WW40_9PLAT|nr:unnamed protein product [Protopolystoma xenopodis]